jgi:predicted O-methyltransferase YrrM
MEFIEKNLADYCENHTSPESELLSNLNRDTHLKVVSPRMLSGHLQGRFLSFISKLQKPQLIIEIGTYTGYSALCLAEGLTESGKLISIDVNEETSSYAQSFIDKSAYKNQIKLVVADAKDFIPTISNPIDLVFIDADKKNYLAYYQLIIEKLNTGGIIIADNVLWSGKITMPEGEMDRETLALHEFNEFVQNDGRVENMLLPIRDGLMVIRKK